MIVQPTQVDRALNLPDRLFPRESTKPARTRARLTELERDTRFLTSYLVSRTQSLGLALYRPRVPRFPDAAYDAASLAPGYSTSYATDWCLVGGRADLTSGFLSSRLLERNDPGLAFEAHSLLAEALRIARADGRHSAALYIDATDHLFLTAARARGFNVEVTLGERAIIDCQTDMSGYLQTLSSSRRNMVRRDLRDLGTRGFEAHLTNWTSILDEVAPLIADTHRRHGASDHEVLVKHRLQTWATATDSHGVAFALRNQDGLVGASIGWVWDATLEMYELGLDLHIPTGRRLAYLELLIYAPLRLCWRLGLHHLDLALDSARPKRLRGARMIAVSGLFCNRRPNGAPPT